jgi:ribosomal protein S18 acetylase RimI-like enzyme
MASEGRKRVRNVDFAILVLTIALNVRENNAAAKHVYEGLGFQRYCGYVEAVAIKRD